MERGCRSIACDLVKHETLRVEFSSPIADIQKQLWCGRRFNHYGVVSVRAESGQHSVQRFRPRETNHRGHSDTPSIPVVSGAVFAASFTANLNNDCICV